MPDSNIEASSIPSPIEQDGFEDQVCFYQSKIATHSKHKGIEMRFVRNVSDEGLVGLHRAVMRQQS